MIIELGPLNAGPELTAKLREDHNFLEDLNLHSREIITACLEPSLRDAQAEERFQFERHGHLVADRRDSPPGGWCSTGRRHFATPGTSTYTANRLCAKLAVAMSS